MATIKNYERKKVEGREDVEYFTPGRLGVRLKTEDMDGAPAESGADLPFALEDDALTSSKKPHVIHGEPGQRDRRQIPLSEGGSVAGGTSKKSSVLAGIEAELASPTVAPNPVAKPGTPPAKPVGHGPGQTPETPPASATSQLRSLHVTQAHGPQLPASQIQTPQKQPDKKRKRMSTDPKEQGRMVAESVVGGFVGALRGQAAKRGGHLSIEDVEALGRSFERQADVLAETFSRQLKSYAEARNKSHWVHERNNCLNRLVVKQFSHLLLDETEFADKPEGLSRRILPGFFQALEMMIGVDQINAFQDRANRIVENLRRRFGADFSWDHAYVHRETKALVLDLLVTAAPHFEDIDKRLDWMVELINTSMPSARPTSAKPDWQLESIGLVRLLNALFADLKMALEDDLGRLRITKRHGFEVLEALLDAFDTFDKKIAAAAKAP